MHMLSFITVQLVEWHPSIAIWANKGLKRWKLISMLPSFSSSSSPPSFHHLYAYLVPPRLNPHHHTCNSSAKSYAICHYWPHRKPFLSMHSTWLSVVKVQQSELWHTNLGFSPSAWTSNLMVPWFQCLSVPTPNITSCCPPQFAIQLTL